MEIKKYFVKVGTGVDRATVITTSAANPSKIYFLYDSSEIVVNGKAYGASYADMANIKTALGAYYTAVGTLGYKSIEEAINDIIGVIGIKGTAGSGTVGQEDYVAPTAATGLYKEINDKVKAAVDELVGSAPEALDTIQELAAWITAHKDSEGGAAGYLVKDVNALKTAVGSKGTAAVTAVEGHIWQEGGIYKKVGEEYVKVQDVSELVAGETYYYSENGGTTWKVSTEASATANVDDNGQDTGNGDWYGYRVPVAASDATTSTGLYKEIEDAVEAASHAKTTVVTGTANGTVAVDGTDVAVKGLGSAAYTEATAYDASGAAKAVQGETTATVKDLEDKIGVAKDGETPGTGLTGRIEALEAADAVHTTVANKTTGHITVATGEGKVVTISENDIASATELAGVAAIVGKAATAAQGTEGTSDYVPATEATGLVAKVTALESAAEDDIWETYVAPQA